MSRPSNGNNLRICLTGGWFSSDNVGDNAILTGIQDSFPPESHFTAFSSSPSHVQAKHGIAAVAPKKNPLDLYASLRGADALLFTGGTPFYDELPHMAYFAGLTAAARVHRVPVIVFGIALRTLSSGPCRGLARFICNSACYAAAREERSRRLMGELVGQQEKVRLLPDPAIRMTPIDIQQAESELAALGLPQGRRRAAVCLRDFTAPASFRAAHYSKTYDTSDIVQMIQAVADMCVKAVAQHEAEIVFFPMNTKAPDDDREPARQVGMAVKDLEVRQHLHIAEKQYGPREMKGLLGRMDAVLGVRFHSLVLSSSMGVPAYAIDYAPKTSAIMEFFGRGQYVQPLSAFEGRNLIETFNGILADPSVHREGLARRLREIHATYNAELASILEVIQRKKACRRRGSVS